MKNHNVLLARDGIMALMGARHKLSEDRFYDLLTDKRMHPQDFGEPGPRMGLDPTVPNPYLSGKETVRQALKAMVAENILVRSNEGGEIIYMPGPNFVAGEVEYAKVLTMKAVADGIVHPGLHAQMRPNMEPVYFSQIRDRVPESPDILAQAVAELAQEGLLSDMTDHPDAKPLPEHAFCITKRGLEYIRQHESSLAVWLQMPKPYSRSRAR